MATISIAATGVITRSKTISTSDTVRLLNAFRKVYGQVVDQAEVTEVRDQNGNITTPASPATYRDMTDQEIFNKFADGVFDSFKGTVRGAELIPLQTAAVAAVTSSFTGIAFT